LSLLDACGTPFGVYALVASLLPRFRPARGNMGGPFCRET